MTTFPTDFGTKTITIILTKLQNSSSEYLDVEELNVGNFMYILENLDHLNLMKVNHKISYCKKNYKTNVVLKHLFGGNRFDIPI